MKPDVDMDSHSTLLVKAGKKEIPVIQYIAKAVYGPTYLAILGQAQVDYMLGKIYSTSALAKQLEQGHVFLIAKSRQREVGFVSFNCENEPQGVFKIQKLYVLPEVQGSGLGAYLVKTVISLVRQRGGKILQLNVNRFNRARDFYEKQGFIVKETVDIPIGEGYFMNDYVMEMDLKEGEG